MVFQRLHFYLLSMAGTSVYRKSRNNTKKPLDIIAVKSDIFTIDCIPNNNTDTHIPTLHLASREFIIDLKKIKNTAIITHPTIPPAAIPSINKKAAFELLPLPATTCPIDKDPYG